MLLLRDPNKLIVAMLAGVSGHLGKFRVKWGMATMLGAPAGLVALGLAWSPLGYLVIGALGGLLGWVTLTALRRAGFFAYLAEKR